MNLDHRNTALWGAVLYGCAVGAVVCFVASLFWEDERHIVMKLGYLCMLGTVGASTMLKRAGKWN